MKKILPLMTILGQVSLAHTFRLDLGKLCHVCWKSFLSTLGLGFFQSQVMTVAFFWMELGGDKVCGLGPVSPCSGGAEARIWKVGQGPI